MRPRWIWAAAALVLALHAAPLRAAEGFRGIPWGSTRDEVTAQAGPALLESEEMLLYADTLAGYGVMATYVFADGVLVSGGYLLTDEFVNANRYLEVYDLFVELLEQKYGPPILNRSHWKGGALFRDDPADWGLAVSMGYLERTAYWQTDETRIMVSLRGESFEVTLGVLYVSRAHEGLLEQQREAEAESKL